MPEHNHADGNWNRLVTRDGRHTPGSADNSAHEINTYSDSDRGIIKAAGGDVPHNNIQPSIITHVWERIG